MSPSQHSHHPPHDREPPHAHPTHSLWQRVLARSPLGGHSHAPHTHRAALETEDGLRTVWLALATQEHPHDESQPHAHGLETAPRTEGATISWAFLYDLLVKFLLGGKEKEFRESIIAQADIRPSQKVLDVGCGTGQMVITARLNAPPTAEIYGTDASPEMIARARELAAKAGVTIDFRTGLVEAIAFPDNALDVVLSNFMVHHLPDSLKVKAFAEIYRVLKPGGRLQIVEFEPPTNPVRRFFLGLLLKDMMHINTRAIPLLLIQAGFTDVTRKGSSHPLATVITGKKG